MAAPQTFLIVSGGFDVSVGATIAISTVSLGLLLQAGVPMAAAIVVVLVIGLAVGTTNATLVVLLRVNPLIATLGTMSIFTGLAHYLSAGQTEVVRSDFLRWITKTQVGPVSVLVFMFIGVYAISVLVERTTVLGRWVYAIGGNAEAARLAGLPIRRVQYALYIASGLSAAVGGVLLTGILQSASPRVGATFLLSVVTAVILGGASLTGGRGSIVGTLIAVAILGVLQERILAAAASIVGPDDRTGCGAHHSGGLRWHGPANRAAIMNGAPAAAPVPGGRGPRQEVRSHRGAQRCLVHVGSR